MLVALSEVQMDNSTMTKAQEVTVINIHGIYRVDYVSLFLWQVCRVDS